MELFRLTERIDRERMEAALPRVLDEFNVVRDPGGRTHGSTPPGSGPEFSDDDGDVA